MGLPPGHCPGRSPFFKATLFICHLLSPWSTSPSPWAWQLTFPPSPPWCPSGRWGDWIQKPQTSAFLLSCPCLNLNVLQICLQHCLPYPLSLSHPPCRTLTPDLTAAGASVWTGASVTSSLVWTLSAAPGHWPGLIWLLCPPQHWLWGPLAMKGAKVTVGKGSGQSGLQTDRLHIPRPPCMCSSPLGSLGRWSHLAFSWSSHFVYNITSKPHLLSRNWLQQTALDPLRFRLLAHFLLLT